MLSAIAAAKKGEYMLPGRPVEIVVSVLAFLIGLSVLPSAQVLAAGTVTWDAGGGTDTTWSEELNWAGDALPASDDLAQFGSAGSTATVDASQTVNGLIFGRGAGFTVDGSQTLTLGASGIAVDDAEEYHVTAPLKTDVDQSWSIATNGVLEANWAEKSTGPRTVTRTGPGTLVLTGYPTAGTNGVGFAAAEGVTQLNGADAVLDAGSGVTIGTDGGPPATLEYLADDQMSRGSLESIAASGTLDLNAFSYVTQGLTMTGGTVQTDAGGVMVTSGPEVTFTYDATVDGGQANFTGAGNLDLQGNTDTERIFDIAGHSGLAREMVVNSQVINSKENTIPRLKKTGAGTLEFAGDNTFTGTTEVQQGRLLITGNTTGQGSYTVSGGVLGGEGTIGLADGETLSVSGGTLAPGTSTGVLTVDGDVSFSEAGTFGAEINGVTTPGIDYDQLVLTGSDLVLGGTLDASFGAFSASPGDTVYLIDNQSSGVTSGFFQFTDDEIIGEYNGWGWAITYDADAGVSLDGGNDVALYATPEPASALLGILMALTLLAGRRKGVRG